MRSGTQPEATTWAESSRLAVPKSSQVSSSRSGDVVASVLVGVLAVTVLVWLTARPHMACWYVLPS